MELLPKDIQTIVYRYIFDYKYMQVKHQYRDVWLLNNVIWCDEDYCFVNIKTGRIANRRDYWCEYPTLAEYLYRACGIRKFDILNRSIVQKTSELPNRYFY